MGRSLDRSAGLFGRLAPVGPSPSPPTPWHTAHKFAYTGSSSATDSAVGGKGSVRTQRSAQNSVDLNTWPIPVFKLTARSLDSTIFLWISSFERPQKHAYHPRTELSDNFSTRRKRYRNGWLIRTWRSRASGNSVAWFLDDSVPFDCSDTDCVDVILCDQLSAQLYLEVLLLRIQLLIVPALELDRVFEPMI